MIPADERRDGALTRRAARLADRRPPWWGGLVGPTGSQLAAWAAGTNTGLEPEPEPARCVEHVTAAGGRFCSRCGERVAF